jgi:hypothetical protein
MQVTQMPDTLAPIPQPADYPEAPACERGPTKWGHKKKDTTMSRYDNPNIDISIDTEAPTSDIQRTRDYLNDRVSSIFWKKDDELRRQFGLIDDDRPETVTDLLARIAAGKFTISEDKKDSVDYDPIRFIKWRDPSVKEDQAGYRLAHAASEKQSTAIRDAIAVLDPKDALAAVQAYEAWTYKAPVTPAA